VGAGELPGRRKSRGVALDLQIDESRPGVRHRRIERSESDRAAAAIELTVLTMGERRKHEQRRRQHPPRDRPHGDTVTLTVPDAEAVCSATGAKGLTTTSVKSRPEPMPRPMPPSSETITGTVLRPSQPSQLAVMAKLGASPLVQRYVIVPVTDAGFVAPAARLPGSGEDAEKRHTGSTVVFIAIVTVSDAPMRSADSIQTAATARTDRQDMARIADTLSRKRPRAAAF